MYTLPSTLQTTFALGSGSSHQRESEDIQLRKGTLSHHTNRCTLYFGRELRHGRLFTHVNRADSGEGAVVVVGPPLLPHHVVVLPHPSPTLARQGKVTRIMV